MKSKLLNALIAVILFLMPNVNFGQSAPDLGTASGFALFTAVGAFDNIGASYVIGDVGTNVGAFNAFPPGTLVGQKHVADPASAQAATDIDVAYSYLDGVTCGPVIGVTLGNGQVLTPEVYCIGAAATLNADLILDGEGNSDALFIIKIDGSLSTSTFSSVTLINSASLCNVYWQINGEVTLGDSSVFRGTIVANGAISLLEAASLEGRGLSRGGAISLHNNFVTVSECTCVCTAPVITSIDSVCGTIASMCWTSVPCAASYLVRWNILPDLTWIYTEISAPDTCRQFTDQYGDVNQLQVASICQNGDTLYSPLVTWTNYLVCAAPTGLVASNITTNSADLSWNANPDANKYAVLYKANGTKTKVKVNGTILSLTGLSPATTIKWRVKSRCDYCPHNSWGTNSPFTSFTTAPFKEFALDQQSAGSMLVYPNPADANFTVRFNIGYSSEQSYTLAVQDLVGHSLMIIEGTLSDGTFSQDVSLPNGISNGIYFVTVITDGKQFRERIVVNKE
ncbi:MAG TPA: ice-binding family protein [Chitinophagales bacterium]|nr:ice-binding family protein [Chitinophagales bacterium]